MHEVRYSMKRIKYRNVLMLTIMMLPLFASCGDDNNETEKDSNKSNIVLGRWVKVNVITIPNQSYPNILEKDYNLDTFVVTISSTNGLTGTTDSQSITYSSFDEMASQVNLDGFIFDETSTAKPIKYVEGEWKEYGAPFKYDIRDNTLYSKIDEQENIIGTISNTYGVQRIVVRKSVNVSGTTMVEEHSYIKY